MIYRQNFVINADSWDPLLIFVRKIEGNMKKKNDLVLSYSAFKIIFRE